MPISTCIFFSGSVIRGPGSGPIALSTRLGYVLSGPVGIPILPGNYQLSKTRLESLPRRLKLKPEVLKHYDEVIQEQLGKSIIEPVNIEDTEEVIRLDKDTTKLRVVYDASAKCGGPSLNDCLYSGLPLTPMIFDVMARQSSQGGTNGGYREGILECCHCA